MPLINPFTTESEIIEEIKEFTNYDQIIIYLNCQNWKCPSCNSIVFGRTLICPFNQNGIYCRTRKPE